MRIGCPREIKNREYRVGLTPESAKELVKHGHEVWVETEAGTGIGASDQEYEAAGAKIHPDPAILFAECEMIVKVKEPQPNERAMLREGQILYTYLHLAPDPEQTRGLLASGATCFAYETVTANDGSLPLLKPMSEVAGRMSIQVGAHYLEKEQGGRGVLLGGVPGVLPGKVTVIGGGVVGLHAAKMAAGLGADVTVIDRSIPRLRHDNHCPSRRCRGRLPLRPGLHGREHAIRGRSPASGRRDIHGS
jgi:alanine dehydrogenase